MGHNGKLYTYWLDDKAPFAQQKQFCCVRRFFECAIKPSDKNYSNSWKWKQSRSVKSKIQPSWPFCRERKEREIFGRSSKRPRAGFFSALISRKKHFEKTDFEVIELNMEAPLLSASSGVGGNSGSGILGGNTDGGSW